MSHLILNVGLAVGSIVPTGQNIRSLKFLAELFNPSTIRTEVRLSASEPTLIVELVTEERDIANRIHTLCLALNQDAIAWTDRDAGYLTGPKAADWGGCFNPEFFLSPSWKD